MFYVVTLSIDTNIFENELKYEIQILIIIF